MPMQLLADTLAGLDDPYRVKGLVAVNVGSEDGRAGA